MHGKPISKEEISKIKKLRETGHSLPEICQLTKRGGSTVHKYAKDVTVLPKYQSTLRKKQGGSINRAETSWKKSKAKSKKLLKTITKRDKLLILAALYWGEGTKNELNLINSDPTLIQVFISCLKEIGIEKDSFRISIRIYDDININEAKKYWAKICGIAIENILNINILKGKKNGKLPHGMCRVRVAKGGESFKFIISMIDFIRSGINCPRSSVDRTRDS